MQDRNMDPENDEDRKEAVNILRKSAAYGVAMFPDADTNVGVEGVGSGWRGRDDEKDEDGDWDMGVGDEIVRERARVRRKELEEEERLEAEIWARKNGSSDGDRYVEPGKKVGKSRQTKTGKRIEKEMEVMDISESTDAGRPKLRPKKVRAKRETSAARATDNDVSLTSDTASRTTRQRSTMAKRNSKSSKSATTSREGSHIDLCTSSSSDESWTVGRGVSKNKRNAKQIAAAKEESEVRAGSPNLLYPPSEDAPSDADSTGRWKRVAYGKGKGKSKASETDSESVELQLPFSSPEAKLGKPPSDDTTPRPPKAAPKAIGGIANSVDVKCSFPLKIARDRQLLVIHID